MSEDYLKELKKAAKYRLDRSEDADNKPVYTAALNRIVDVVRAAKVSKAQGTITQEQWDAIIEEADRLITANGAAQYQEDPELEYLDPYGAAPDEIKTQSWGIPQRLIELLEAFSGTSLSAFPEAAAELVPPPWSTTPRPSEHSTVLSRFSPEYRVDRVSSLLNGLQATDAAGNLDALRAVVDARVEVRQHREANPLRLAAGTNFIVASGCGMWKERGPCVSVYGAAEPDGELEENALSTGFHEPIRHMTVQNDKIWAALDERIKAFDAEEMDLLHTLNSDGYRGMFGVADDVVFRASAKGTFGAWTKSELQNHEPVFLYDRGVRPFGGKYKPDASLDDDEMESIEVSKGQKPTHTFEVPKITSALDNVVPMPNTTKWLVTFQPVDTLFARLPPGFGIRIFDIAQPESGASLVGLGVGAGVNRLVTSKDLPNMFIAAGDDPLVRIYDLRDPLPQMTLDGHGKAVTSCAVAPFGGQFPIVFSGGRDELVKAWDIRQSKTCLYSLSTGTLEVTDLAWLDGRNTLAVLGYNPNRDRMGNHHGYRKIDKAYRRRQRDKTDEDADEDEEDEWEDEDEDEEEDDYDEDEDEEELEEAIYWRDTSVTREDFFPKRYSEIQHSLLEYKFKVNAGPSVFPPSVRPYLSRDYW